MNTLFSVLLAVARLLLLSNKLIRSFRFLTQYHRNTLKLRTIERFSRAIWTIIIVCLLLGTLRFFEHEATTYTFCMGEHSSMPREYQFRYRTRSLLGSTVHDTGWISNNLYKQAVLENIPAASRLFHSIPTAKRHVDAVTCWIQQGACY